MYIRVISYPEKIGTFLMLRALTSFNRGSINVHFSAWEKIDYSITVMSEQSEWNSYLRSYMGHMTIERF